MKKAFNREEQKINLAKRQPDELDRELLSRGIPGPDDKRFLFPYKEGTPAREGIMTATLKLYNEAFPANPDLSNNDTMELVEALRVGKSSHFKNLCIKYEWLEGYEVYAREMKENALGIAAIINHDSLIQENAHFRLATRNYGTCFNLCEKEPFYAQPIIAGPICTGFLVKEDVVATTAPWITEENVTNLRIIFGYQMQNIDTPVTLFPSQNIFHGVKVLRNTKRHNSQTGWALIKLDRNVKDRSPIKLSDKNVYKGQPIYTLGHPAGLPLKLISGPYVLDDSNENYFTANLGLYGSNSGSPVFDMGSDDVVGFVEHTYYPGFRWTGNYWVSIANGLSGTGHEGVKCTYTRAFVEALASF